MSGLAGSTGPSPAVSEEESLAASDDSAALLDELDMTRGPGEYSREPKQTERSEELPAGSPEAQEEDEGDLFIETQGVGPKYVYRMELSLGNSGLLPASSSNRRKPRNNKLLWRGHWSYNKLTDDWAEFGLKHYQPFFFRSDQSNPAILYRSQLR